MSAFKTLSSHEISVTQTVNELKFIVDSESENNSEDDDGTNDAGDEQREEEISKILLEF